MSTTRRALAPTDETPLTAVDRGGSSPSTTSTRWIARRDRAAAALATEGASQPANCRHGLRGRVLRGDRLDHKALTSGASAYADFYVSVPPAVYG
jgi:hypothetical protein